MGGLTIEQALEQSRRQGREYERALIMRWLLNGITRSADGSNAAAWDSEMRSYAKAFAADIQTGQHLPTFERP